jgi:ribonuclease D
MPNSVFLNADKVGQLPELVTNAGRIGLDTEFMRERTYYPQLCLVQVATDRAICCVDPLDAPDIEVVWQTLMPASWVVHSGRQDIEVVYQTAGRMPAGLFDTQVAAALLGYQPQLGYAALVAELFGVQLAKSHTRADWSRRPLAAELIEYAAEDVEHLLPAAEQLTERLAAAGRLQWALDDSAWLLDEALYRPDPDDAIRRLKGARRLSGRPLAAARRLAAWREREAEQRNRPRQWILSDAVLLTLALAAPDSRPALNRIEGLPAGAIRRVGDELLEVVAAAAGDPQDGTALPRPDDRHRSRLAAMQEKVSGTAAKLGIVPEVIASKKELTAGLFGERDLRVLRGWRRTLIGNDLLQILED